jgi:signal peptidase I
MHPNAPELLRDLAAQDDLTLTVRGSCMEPVIHDGDTIAVRGRKRYLPGDIIVFAGARDQLFAHRVLGFGPRGLVTRGDHCGDHDSPVALERVIGVVQAPVGLHRRIRAVAAFASLILRKAVR